MINITKIVGPVAGVPLFFSATVFAGFTGISTEMYTGDGWIEHGYQGFTTYRIYANFDTQDDVLKVVFGSPLDPMGMYSSDGLFYNATDYDSLLAPIDLTGDGVWTNQWDTFVTIGSDSADGDMTQLTPGFDGEVGSLAGDFTTDNAAWYVSHPDPPGWFTKLDSYLIARLTVESGQHVWGVVNLSLVDGTHIGGAAFPAPGALAALLAFTALRPSRSRAR